MHVKFRNAKTFKPESSQKLTAGMFPLAHFVQNNNHIFRPESFLRWPSSVCRQCCYTNNCGATWTPQSRSEWAMDMVDASEAEYSFQFIFDYDY